MADQETKDLSPVDAKTQAKNAITSGAAKIVAKRQEDGKWTLTVTEAAD